MHHGYRFETALNCTYVRPGGCENQICKNQQATEFLVCDNGVGRHLARTVNQRQTVLCGELNGYEPPLKQDLFRGHNLAVNKDMPLPNECQCEV